MSASRLVKLKDDGTNLSTQSFGVQFIMASICEWRAHLERTISSSRNGGSARAVHRKRSWVSG